MKAAVLATVPRCPLCGEPVVREIVTRVMKREIRKKQRGVIIAFRGMECQHRFAVVLTCYRLLDSAPGSVMWHYKKGRKINGK